MTDDEADEKADEFIRMLPPDVAQEIANKLVDDGFRAEGFLSPMSTVLIQHLVPANQDWFDLCDRLNRLSQAIWLEAFPDGQRNDANPLSIRLLAKSGHAFQGAVLLAQRGMTAEAQTLARTSLEITFWLGYIVQDAEAASLAFTADECQNGAARSRSLAGLMDAEQAAPFIAAAEHYEAEGAKLPKPPGPKTLAHRAKMTSLYPYYRALCGLAAHPSVASLDRFLETDAEGFLRIKIGPDDDGIAWTLMTAINCHLWGLEAFIAFHDWEKAQAALDDIRKRRDELLTAMAD
jgi:hypothetical protein